MSTAGEYLKQAAASIRRAAEARKSEIDQLRHDVDIEEKEVNNTIENIKKELSIKGRLVLQPDIENITKNVILKEIDKFNSDISTIQHDFNKNKEVKLAAVQSMEGDVNNLLSQASNFESTASRY